MASAQTTPPSLQGISGSSITSQPHPDLLGDGELCQWHLALLQPLPDRLQVAVDPLQLLIVVQRRENLVNHVPTGERELAILGDVLCGVCILEEHEEQIGRR